MIIKNFEGSLKPQAIFCDSNPGYFNPGDVRKNTDYNESGDRFIYTGYYSDRDKVKPVCNREEKGYITELLNDLGHEEKPPVMELADKGNLTEKDVKSFVEEHRNFIRNETLPPVPYYIANLSEEGKKAFIEYIKANNLSKSDVKAILKKDEDWRDIEQMVCEYFAKEREDAKDFCLNMWTEREKSAQSRLKSIKAFYDQMNKTYAEIWANRVKTNQDINDMIYKTFYG